MNQFDAEALILVDILTFADVMGGPEWWCTSGANDLRERNRPAYQWRHLGERFRPSEWYQRSLSSAEARTFCRALVALEGRGLVQRVAGHSRRTTHFYLTGDGVPAALAAVRWLYRDCEPDLDRIILGFERTIWGQEAADAVRALVGQPWPDPPDPPPSKDLLEWIDTARNLSGQPTK